LRLVTSCKEVAGFFVLLGERLMGCVPFKRGGVRREFGLAASPSGLHQPSVNAFARWRAWRDFGSVQLCHN